MIDLSKTYRIRNSSAGELVSELKIFDIEGIRYPVVGAVRMPGGEVSLVTWGPDGYFLNGASGGRNLDLIETAWYDGLKDGDPIMVRMGSPNEWARRHFAGVASNGNVLVYSNGRSKWANDGAPPCEFSEGRKPTAKELEE